ncbi:MAG: sugar phosphate isomerase/epimerase [Chloroflexi bacterium]|nr:sugar phosphate isomerase/epimerase [Chloroflexota bacterium]
MPIELGIATPAVPRDPRLLDDQFCKWAADLGVTVLGTHLGPTPEDVLPYAAEVRERLDGWGLRIVQATGYNPALVGRDAARRDDDLARLARSFRAAQLLGSPMVLTGCGSYHPTHGYGPHPENHRPEARERIVEFLRLAAPRAEDHGVVLALECHLITALDTPEHIREIVEAVGSPSIRVNFDPVNLLSSIDAVYQSGAEMERMLSVLGPYYHWTAHAKDLVIEPRLALHFDETVCGDGLLDWAAYLRCAEWLGTPEQPAAVLVEHMPAFLAPRGLTFVRGQAAAAGIQVLGRRG